MFQGLGEVKRRVFFSAQIPIEGFGKTLKALFFSRLLKRRFPFEEDSTQVWNKKPKLNAAFSHV